MIDEMNDKERRKLNVVVHNLQEPEGLSFSEKAEQDSSRFKEIIKEGLKLMVETTKTFRVGKLTDDEMERSGRRKLTILYTNIDQYLNKREDLAMFISNNEPDLILLCEVIPKAQSHPMHPATMALPNYTMFLNFDPVKDKLGQGGARGICIFISAKWQATEVSFPACSYEEQLWVKLPLLGADQLLIGCLYRSPSSDGNTSTDNLISLLKTVVSQKFSHIVITGDVNMPQIDWNDHFSHAPDGHYTKRFVEGVQECGLTQHVTKATRYRAGERSSSLDIILSNEEGLVTNLAYHPPIGNSDHMLLQFEVCCYMQPEVVKEGRLNLNKGNYLRLNNLIRRRQWRDEMHMDMQERYDTFKTELAHLVNACVPKACPRKNRSIYINREALRLKNRKKKLWAAYTREMDDISHARYVRCKNDLRRLQCPEIDFSGSGSVLAPLLFTLYVNDLPEPLRCVLASK
ncbi:uncharacterized protein LOC122368836 [Amphibalanus amphitrite]|uniref:uncharacterized protein LOC122368836 n=1 Tax=Amphibalanus amphitrite TaxID=1232801 RepID=UPI001C907E27|nr:uncharacterized protein LOC122368836 [Amphibalanus amphitrite]